jgi:hypothetical protein
VLPRIIFFIFIFFLVVSLSSCRSRKEYIERNGLHSDKKPSEIAKEIGELSKKQKRAYKKQLRRTEKMLRKRNKQKQKNIVINIKTKKVRSKTEKSDAPKGKEIIIK